MPVCLRNRLRAAGLIIAMALVSACSLTPNAPATDPAPNHWGFTGKIGLWAYGEQESANIDWHDCINHYLIRLSGPLGVGGALIYGDNSSVSLHRGAEDSISADTPEELLANMGWYLPVSSLRFWLRGQPAPDAPYQQAPEAGRASTLNQSGWDISYGYQSEKIARINMNNGQIRLKWIIRNWRDAVECPAP